MEYLEYLLKMSAIQVDRNASIDALFTDGRALGLSPGAILTRSAATQRGRLLVACALVVAEKGYAGATVSDVVSRAGVSRTAFYEHFAGKEECLLEAYRAAIAIALERMAQAAAQAASEGWRAALAAGVESFFATIREHPAIARATYVEFAAAGPRALDARREGNESFAMQIESLARSVRDLDPEMPEADPRLIRLLVSGMDLQLAYALNGDRPRELESLAEVAREALAAIFATPLRQSSPQT
jgi:AcrR family transcriptional regulator